MIHEGEKQAPLTNILVHLEVFGRTEPDSLEGGGSEILT
jgi:hypothetical protein